MSKTAQKTPAPNVNPAAEGKVPVAPVVESTHATLANALANGQSNRAECARVVFECVRNGARPDRDQTKALRAILSGAFAQVVTAYVKMVDAGASVEFPAEFDAADLL